MKNMLMAAAAAVALLSVSAPAQAATVIPVINSPFTTAGQVGGFFTLTNTPATYDFTFSLTKAFKTFAQLQLNGAAPVSFSLFSGAPGSGSLVFSSGAPSTAPSFSGLLGVGSYYLETVKTTGKTDLISGAISVSAVPEPATWAMMIVGFFGLGAMLRRSRRNGALVTA